MIDDAGPILPVGGQECKDKGKHAANAAVTCARRGQLVGNGKS